MISFRALASGSSGNSFLLQTGKSKLLFDVGLRLSTVQRFLAGEGVSPTGLTGVLISHEHTDHCIGARELAQAYKVPIWANMDALRAAKLHDLPTSGILEVGQPMRFGDVEVTSFPVSHDAVRPVGFRIETQSRVVVIATDLGEPTEELLEVLSQADLVVLEANHDMQMLHESRYPPHLRRRVAGPKGHLSNIQCATVLREVVKGPEVDVWLAHLSKENNTAGLAGTTVRKWLKAAGLGDVGVQVLKRDKPSLHWNGMPRPRQLSMFAGVEI